jgi:amidohydrolase
MTESSLPPIDLERLVADRRHFHRYPELGYREERTAAYIADRLEQLGYTVRTGVGRTGVVGTRESGHGRRAVLIRADMDALPVNEETDLPFRSTEPGVMHACGHDGHMAVGLAVAERLARVSPAGTVKLVFQPAEEGGAGAAAMIRDGTLEDPAVDAAIGIHLWSDLPTGTVAITPGPVFASVDNFTIEITGRGGHAAAPHQTVDPIVVAAEIVTALQTIVSRRRNPADPAVVTVTGLHAGTAHNVIPDTATLLGTVRTYGAEFRNRVPELFEELVTGIATASGASARVHYERLYPTTVNDPTIASRMTEAAASFLESGQIRSDYRTMAAEDMAFFLERVPGCYAFVGCGNARKGTDRPHHSPRFDLDEDALPVAVELLSRAAVALLGND